MKKVVLSLVAVFVVVGVALFVAVGTSQADQNRTDQAQVAQKADEIKPGTAVAKKFCPDGWKVEDFKSSKDYNCVPKPMPKPDACEGPFWECNGCKCRCYPITPPS
ncbi:MAG: hypothetical protein FJ109_09800 [Deltaproteobacteria bacterium]|nr:hypothetical protein [Deltaproteobacteria bacterium]